ncbi:MAG: hypothetical protein MUE87_00530 [Methanothrix sp.]|jgi:hypothetical protein|nr:hypothetical protein [Methanothrix sp.]
MMPKNPEFAKCASDLARYQDTIRSANEDLIKLSQRFGRMMPKLSKLDSSSILSWFGLYNKIKDKVRLVDGDLAAFNIGEQASSSPLLQMQINSYYAQRQRLGFKMEILDDILGGMMEDLIENGSFEEIQKEEMRTALEASMEKSLSSSEVALVPA